MDNRETLTEQLFGEAMELPREERSAFLEKACRGVPELQRAVEALLAENDRLSGFLSDSPHLHAQADAWGYVVDEIRSSTTANAPAEGTVLGHYLLLEKIGEGGMGEVWLAEQREPVRRRVALKLILAGMNTREVMARFESERQALALMDHPAIAKVFDAGSTPAGLPYFVMEYVAGTPINTYCDRHKLTMRQRMELFIQVCEGVQHAHQKAIIHRDLKPSNILVCEVDGKPMPKIIDFGLAKATSQRLTDASLFTRVGAVLGTIDYMSPEQAGSGGEDIDTRTDVYSLGVVLYQLLAGALPLDLKKLAYQEVLRRIREQDVPRPSSRILTQGGDSTITAQNRGTDPPALTRQLRGDPDAVALKALEKDRKRRYGSPSELAADLGRYLRNEPIAAHPPSTAYRARKYIRRHRLGVAIAAAAVLLLAGFSVRERLQLQRITQEREHASRERDRADRITQFMTNMFKVSDPSEARGNTVTAREILDKSSTDIKTSLTKDPELQAQMLHVMGNVYSNLGLYPSAQSLQQQSMEIRQRVLGPEHPDTLQSMTGLAVVLDREGHYAEAEKLSRGTLDIRRRVLGPEHPDTVKSMINLAATLSDEGHPAEAEKLDREALDIQRRVLGPEHPDTLTSMNNLAGILSDQGHPAEAEKLYRETLDMSRHVLGAESPATLASVNGLANALAREGHYGEAEKLYREMLDMERRILGPDHPDTLTSLNNLAFILGLDGRYVEAETLHRETLDIQRRVLGPEHRDTLTSMSNLANDLRSEGNFVEAEKWDRETLDIRRRVLGPEHPDTLDSMQNLANDLLSEGHYAQAEKLHREAVDIDRRVLGLEHPDTIGTLSTLAVDLSHEGRFGEAEKLFRQALQLAEKSNQPVVLSNAWYNFACGAAVAGRHGKALRYLRKAIEHGLTNPDAIAADPDLKSLHADPGFDALVAEARQKTPPTAK
jgi:eukaryotic-like serine/threonine-protein kinase